ncbi:MAG: ABC transporter ATP-binding protein [Planctomycetota bacterium]
MRVTAHDLGCKASSASEHWVLRGVHCVMEPGTLTSLSGRSGSGKSTLLRALAGLTAPTEGSIRYEDREPWGAVRSEQARFRRRCVGFVFQEARFFDDLDLLDNTALPAWFESRARARAEARRALERLEIAHLAHRRPIEVSYGQAQRCGIARAIVNGPRVLFADEPTASLDAESARIVADLFEELRSSGVTILSSSHGDSPWRHVDSRWQIAESRLVVIYP